MEKTRDDAGLTAEERATVRSTRRFDLRRLIGGLFALYGVLLVIVGIINHDTDLAMTGGLAINTWTGAAMLVAAALFFVWDHYSPVPVEDIVKNLRQEDELAREGADPGSVREDD